MSIATLAKLCGKPFGHFRDPRVFSRKIVRFGTVSSCGFLAGVINSLWKTFVENDFPVGVDKSSVLWYNSLCRTGIRYRAAYIQLHTDSAV